MAYDILEERIALINTRDGHFIRIKLWNSGSVPILDEDHDVPIIFNFGKRAEVVRVNCFATDPPTLNAHLNKDSGNAILEKPIPKLNGGESITFDVEVHDYDKINISSHITWIKKIIEMPQDLNRGISICIVLTALCGAFFLIIEITSALTGNGVIKEVIDLAFVGIVWAVWLIRSFEFRFRRLYAIARSSGGIAFVLLSYSIIHFSTIAFLPAILAFWHSK